MFRNLQAMLFALLLVSCANQKSNNSPEYKRDLKVACSSKDRAIPLVGEAETITIATVGDFKSRIDTGAKTVSVNATEIKKFVYKGEDWVSFNLKADDGTSKKIKKPIQKTSKNDELSCLNQIFYQNVKLYLIIQIILVKSLF